MSPDLHDPTRQRRRVVPPATLAFVSAVMLISPSVLAAPAPTDRPVVKLALKAPRGGKPLSATVTRSRDADGGAIVKLLAEGVGPRPQALTLYTGGGADDGAGDDDLLSIEARQMPLPDGAPAVRVDVRYRVPDGRMRQEEVETFLVGFDGKTHKLLSLLTLQMKDRSKARTCREGVRSQLEFRAADGGAVELVASSTRAVEPLLGDDDLPIDRTCKAAPGVSRVIYRMAKGQTAFEQIDPPPPPAEEDEEE